MFKKSKYLITSRENGNIVFKEKEGYSFSVNGHEFGICKRGNAWDITEISSGLFVTIVLKRKDAIEEIKRITPSIEAALKNSDNKKFIKMVKQEYEKRSQR
mgnify:CR=1 FL=1